MPKTATNNFNKLLSRLKTDFPQFNFQANQEFHWSPTERTIFFNQNEVHAADLLLHELAHAVLGHDGYNYDAELIKKELAAWQYSQTNFYPQYKTKFNQALADEYLDYYRNWLYERSLCPNCGLTGQQTTQGHYTCLTCQNRWQPNPAKQTALRRRQIK